MVTRLLIALVLGVLLAAGAHAAPNATVTLVAQSAPAAGRPLNLSLSFSRLPDLQPIPTSAFVVSHEQLLHVVGVGADLDTFLHWHPTHKTPSAFLITGVAFPKAGTYLVAADGQLAQGLAANSSRISIPGTPAMGAAPNATATAWGAAAAGNSTNPTVLVVRSVPLQPQQQPAVSLRALTVSPAALNATLAAVSAVGNASLAGLYTATLFGPQGVACRPGVPQTYVWTLTRKVSRYNTSSSSISNLPVSDLRPYYGAPMHLAVVRSDLGYIHHGHGEVVPAGRVADSNSSGNSSQAPGTNNTENAEITGTASVPSSSAGGSNATEVAAGRGHAGHGRHMQAAATNGSQDQASSTTAAAQPLAAGQAPSGSVPQPGGSDSGTTADLFGPVLKTDVTFPSAGSYLMVGQMARGNELILVPVFVACTG